MEPTPSFQPNTSLPTDLGPTLPLPPPKQPLRHRKPVIVGVIVVVVAITAALLILYRHQSSKGTPAGQPLHATSATGTCAVSNILVNACRPWVGAAVNGNPGAASDQISQFNYLEQLLGRPLDIYRTYHSCLVDTNGTVSCPTGNMPLNPNETHFAERANTYIDVNWKPAATLAEADGGNTAVNAEIKQAADNIKAIAPHKIFLSVWHEPQNDVSGTNCSGKSGTAGSPSQYIAMWQNVRKIFDAEGVHNVVWVMNYMGAPNFQCLVAPLWPGDNLVDWVTYDTYSRGKTWDATSGNMYQALSQQSGHTTNADGAPVNLSEKPWGVTEFGTCKQPSSGISETQYFQSVKAGFDSGAYANLKMLLIYADTGNNAGKGCLTNYDSSGQQDQAKQTAVEQLFNDPLFTKQ